jgi:hypothetical protein
MGRFPLVINTSHSSTFKRNPQWAYRSFIVRTLGVSPIRYSRISVEHISGDQVILKIVSERLCVQNCLKEKQDTDFAPFIRESHYCLLAKL